ncbi:MAG: AraC family transcriptional regulator [Propionivibrio sp.]|uniref:AraC family transcriptional regulator n=1 Tax=Propionivibrio sp. TaxID=2212460 RepID=UPI001A4E98CD|nr:AraC family transcriptional regulator [Propionivibrio sp.]MBL8416565.1 AraC family transcriptional regulator [Propionivibrio sp.]
MVRVGPISAIPDLLREFGVAPDRLLSQFDLTERIFENPDNTIPFPIMGSLFMACVRATACLHFGLLTGQRSAASELGAAGFLVNNAPDVMTALNDLVSNFDLQDRGSTPFLEVSDKTSLLGYEIYHRGIAGSDQISDGAMAIGWNIMRALCGSEWLPLEVHFRHDLPEDVGVYQRFFQSPLRFNAARTALVFRSTWLTRKVRLADPLLRHHFLRHVSEMRRYSNEDFRDRAYRDLLLLIGANRCSLEQLSRHFSMHPRTLNRRLKEAGTSFRDLHNEARHATACQLLRDTMSSIEAIAVLLGYSGTSAFNRAFAHWEGVPPATWRKRARASC